MNIAQLIEKGESKTLEFKRDVSSLLPIIKTITAFANTAGGILLIGVADDHHLVNVTEPDKVRDRISSSVGDSIHPQLQVNIEKISIKDKTLLAITVEKGRAPYHLKAEGLEQGAYVRIGATTRLATEETITEIYRQGQHIYYDAQPCFHAVAEDLDDTLLTTYFEKIGKTRSPENLVSLGLLTREGGKLVPTNAGMVLFGAVEKRLWLFPNTRISCARFKGINKAVFIDRQDYDFDFFTAIEDVPRFIQRHTLNSAKIEGMYRQDIPEYPPVALREILINAFLHANYEIKGCHFMIAVYDDRIEIQNPGIFPLIMTIEDFKAGISRVRNPIIARVFREVGLIEEWGSGYKRIETACQTLGCLKLPTWHEFGSVLRVIVYPRPSLDLLPDLVPKREQVGSKSDKYARKILEQAVQPQTLAEITASFGLSNRTKFRYKYINPLLEHGLLGMTIPEKPNSRLQKYVITPLGLQYLAENKTDE